MQELLQYIFLAYSWLMQYNWFVIFSDTINVGIANAIQLWPDAWYLTKLLGNLVYSKFTFFTTLQPETNMMVTVYPELKYMAYAFTTLGGIVSLFALRQASWELKYDDLGQAARRLIQGILYGVFGYITIPLFVILITIYRITYILVNMPRLIGMKIKAASLYRKHKREVKKLRKEFP